MTSFEKDLKIFEPVVLITGLILILVLLFIFYVMRGLSIEEYCSQKADQIVPKENKTKLYPASEAEKKQDPVLDQPNASISGIYREILKCEREQKRFFII